MYMTETARGCSSDEKMICDAGVEVGAIPGTKMLMAMLSEFRQGKRDPDGAEISYAYLPDVKPKTM